MNKHKFKKIFLTIITFGLIWIKWKKQMQHTENSIYQIDKVPFEMNNLIEFCGENNIISANDKLSKVEIVVSDIKQVNVNGIRNLKGISGIFVKSNSLILILGEFSKAVAARLNQKLLTSN
ncbi:PTS glucose transporter subunit IIB [Mycoplasma corogypsi]|uniref:PTS glucose transporter subunit IIB n=1 Tax=Mycoplasma corogypsi TaxID=2106 RepID=UPI0038735F9C